MESINKEYLDVIKKCKFISSSGEWFVNGTECTIEDDVIYPDYNRGDKFNVVCGLFRGKTMNAYYGYSGDLPREDCESCSFSEFLIYDEFGNDITDLTLEEYKFLLNSKNDK